MQVEETTTEYFQPELTKLFSDVQAVVYPFSVTHTSNFTSTTSSTTCTPVVSGDVKTVFYVSSTANATGGCPAGVVAPFAKFGLSTACEQVAVGVAPETIRVFVADPVVVVAVTTTTTAASSMACCGCCFW